MPLLKRKPFSLLEPPKDLDPKEKIFQVRFTKEIFRDYQEYLKRLNLYRQRVWTCKVSGKSNLTFEEALFSEHNAMEKAQKLPSDLKACILRMTQYSTHSVMQGGYPLLFCTLGLYELVDKIYASLQEEAFEGVELHAKKDGSEAPCKILKILDSGESKMYEVGWFGLGKTVISTSVVKAADLIQRRAPVSRNILRIFIRDATSQSTPWVIREHLSRKYGIPTEPPEDILYNEGLRKRGRKSHENGTIEDGMKKLKRDEGNTNMTSKYPIDDLLLRPAGDDPAWSKRPPLATEFRMPKHSVGDLLIVWDFCLSFGRLLKLSPFSLTDLENAICHKESSALVVDIHAAIFRLLMKDQGDYFTILKNNKRNLKISLVTWAEYLCDFLEITKIEDLTSNISTVRRGYYGLIDTDIKLKILRELVEEAVTTSAIRGILSERVDQKQALAATRRGVRKDKEEHSLNPKISTENEKNQIDGVQDGNGSIDDQVRGTELNKNSSRGKTDGKWYLVQKLETDEKLSIRSSPLGKDRHYNRYWFFRREGRFFVESADSREWGYYSSKEELDALMGSLNVKGIRERALKRQLEKFYSKISNALEKRSKDIAHKMLLEEAVLRRSTRVRAQPKDNPNMAFLKYVNKWKDN